jgi:hypothetical protein
MDFKEMLSTIFPYPFPKWVFRGWRAGDQKVSEFYNGAMKKGMLTVKYRLT